MATVRAGNVIGGGDWSKDRLVPDCIESFMTGEPVRLRAPGAVRPWQHVLDPLCGYLLLAEFLFGTAGGAVPHAWNFGPASEDERTVEDLARHLARCWGDEASLDLNDRGADLCETASLRLNSHLARTRLGWAPQWSLGEAAERTVDWYRAWVRGEDLAMTTDDQITEYARVR